MLVVSCAHAPPSGATRRFDWLVGTWVAESDGVVTTETWLRDGRTYRAENSTVKNGETVHTETIAIEARGEQTYYVATPSGQTKTSFRLARVNGTTAVFENPTHDFPKRITYTRTGDELVATIFGDGKSSEWRFRLR